MSPIRTALSNMIAMASIAGLLFPLIGCGGGSSGSSDGGRDDANESTNRGTVSAGLDGIWAYQWDIDFSDLKNNTPIGSRTQASISNTEFSTGLHRFSESKDELLWHYCSGFQIVSLDDAEPLSDGDVIRKLGLSSAVTYFRGQQLCTDVSEQYVEISPTEYRLDLLCDNKELGSIWEYKVSDDTAFDYGTVEISSLTLADFDMPSAPQICGGVTGGQRTMRSADSWDSETHYTEIRFAALSDDELLAVQFDFPFELKVGDYPVRGASKDATHEVIVHWGIVDNEFDSIYSNNFPDSGSVTITSVSPSAASGEFFIYFDGRGELIGTFAVAVPER